MRYYHMIIQPAAARGEDAMRRRREYISARQGAAPAGWTCVGVCGYHDAKRPRACAPDPCEGGRRR